MLVEAYRLVKMVFPRGRSSDWAFHPVQKRQNLFWNVFHKKINRNVTFKTGECVYVHCRPQSLVSCDGSVGENKLELIEEVQQWCLWLCACYTHWVVMPVVLHVFCSTFKPAKLVLEKKTQSCH